MSIEAVAWAFTVAELKTSEKIALVGLANFADEYGVCYPRQDTLCEMCSLAERTLRAALTELEKRKLILRLERRRADGSRRSDVYLLSGFGRRKQITPETDHAALSAQDIVAMADKWDSKWQDLPVDDPDLFHGDQPANPAASTGKSCQTNRQISPDQPANLAGIYRTEPSIGIEDEERASAPAYSNFVREVCEAMGSPDLASQPFWRLEAENGAFRAEWVKLGLSEDAICDAARAHAASMPDPPNGPKGLDQAMKRKASLLAAQLGAAKPAGRGKDRKPATAEEKLAFYAEWLRSGRYVPPSALSSSIKQLLIDRGVVTEQELKSRGLLA